MSCLLRQNLLETFSRLLIVARKVQQHKLLLEHSVMMHSSQRYESRIVDVDTLAQGLHFEFSNRTAPNRFLKAAMEERLCTWDADRAELSGLPGEPMFRLYQEWSEGSIGNIITGSIIFEHDQITQRGDPVIPIGAAFNGMRFEAFAKLARIGKSHGSLILGQINHPGPQIDQTIQARPLSASILPSSGFAGQTFAPARAASTDDIASIVEGFAHCAAYLDQAGFDGVELHAAHGYLLARFLSSATNSRKDEYGGSLVNRTRLVKEIAQAIRQRTRSSFVLGIKLNSVEFQDDFDEREAEQLCALLEESSFDFVELSGGGLEHFEHEGESTRRREAFFVDFAQYIAPFMKQTKLYITGGFKTVPAMVQALDMVQGIGLARPLCQEPRLCKSILAKDVMAVIKQTPSEDDYGITNVVAGTQIRRISQGRQPLDMSQDYDEQNFTRQMHRWLRWLADDRNAYGFFDVLIEE